MRLLRFTLLTLRRIVRIAGHRSEFTQTLYGD